MIRDHAFLFDFGSQMYLNSFLILNLPIPNLPITYLNRRYVYKTGSFSQWKICDTGFPIFRKPCDESLLFQ